MDNYLKYYMGIMFFVLCMWIALTLATSIAAYKYGYLMATQELLKGHFESKYEIKEVEHALILFEKKK